MSVRLFLCPFCGTDVTEFMARCPECKQALPEPDDMKASPNVDSTIVTRAAGTLTGAEKTFFQEGNVLITNSRAVFGGQTFALANITSVRAVEVPQDNTALGCLAVIGFLMLLCISLSTSVGAIGLVLLALALIAMFTKHKNYRVVLATAGAEIKAFDSTDLSFIQRIVEAISQAIVHRG